MTPEEMADLTQQLKGEEGLRLKPYTDTGGRLSIGWGRNLTDVGISQIEAEFLLANDVAAVIATLPGRVPWFPRLDPVRQRVLIDLAFNMGLNGLMGFRRMLAAMERGTYDEAADELLSSHWAVQVPSRAARLSEMLRTGTQAA